jgi:hypothetical protein
MVQQVQAAYGFPSAEMRGRKEIIESWGQMWYIGINGEPFT